MILFIKNALCKRSAGTAGRKDGYIRPNEVLYQTCRILPERIFSCRAVQLKITLDLSEQHNVWRRVVVPLHMSFYGLHRVLKLLGWWDYHLHEFYVYSDETVKKSENI